MKGIKWGYIYMTKYKDWLNSEALEQLEEWAINGLSDEQIAKNINVSNSTYYLWKEKYIEFSEAIKKGKQFSNFEVENALYKRAIGYSYEETILIKIKNADGSEKIEVKKITKQMPGDVGAQVFWLKNRKPNKWKDKRDYTVETSATQLKEMKDIFKDIK